MVGVTASALMGVMSPVIGKLSTLLETEYGKLKGVRRKIAFLRDELRSMNTALETVSESEEASPHAKEWISQLRELSYDVEDCIEIFMHHLDHDDTCHRFIDKITSQLSTLKARHDIGNRINKLKELAQEINDRRRRYDLNNPSATSSRTLEIDPRLPALFEEADRLVGIDDQMDKLVKWLADGIDLNLQRMVVAIVGFGGLGKTTLANQVFQKIKCQFDCTAFVSVSRRPDVNNILTDVLRQVLERRNPISDDQKKDIKRIREDLNMKTLENDNLIRVIKEYLQNNRYFVVIDDIWSKEAWDIIQCAFPQNKNGSRVVATTRNQVVAKSYCFQHGDYVYHMKPLGSEDSKRLLLKRIFYCEDDCPLELKEVTDDILKKCDGLPLAIVNIASLLATKPDTKQEWERVRNSLCSALEQDHELGNLTRLKLLNIRWHPDGATNDEGSCKKSLIKSLCTLGEHNIRSLYIYVEGGSVDFLADSWCPPPRYLQTFRVTADFYLSRLPTWISSLSELTYLNINIEQMGVGDLEVLKDLPALLSLKLYTTESPQETLTIGSSGFQRLKEFEFDFFYGLARKKRQS